jgi:tryptophan-rich sensory protein
MGACVVRTALKLLSNNIYHMNSSYNWYSQLIKPTWSPPAWVFGPVWSVLYVLIAVSFGKVFLSVWQKKIPFIVAIPFILNLVFNFSFTYLQFTLQNNFLAALDIVLVLGTLIWAMIAIYPHIK